MIKYFIQYFLASKNEHAIHSPFVYSLYTQVIKQKKRVPIFIKIEKLRKKLLKNTATITIKDFGAGSKIYKDNIREIRQIAKSAEKSAKFARLLYRLIVHFQPKTIIDLGTSLGITTIYQALAQPDAQVYTFEGCPATATIAQENFQEILAHNITLIEGNIDETLPTIIERLPSIDFAFFDANHRYQPTINYFELCRKKATESSVFVFDDIHWSDEMHEAWQYIRNHPDVRISIDLFFVGIIFFRTNQPKQDFTLRF